MKPWAFVFDLLFLKFHCIPIQGPRQLPLQINKTELFVVVCLFVVSITMPTLVWVRIQFRKLVEEGSLILF